MCETIAFLCISKLYAQHSPSALPGKRRARAARAGKPDMAGRASWKSKKLGKTLGLSTMPLYLKRWGFTAPKPLTRAAPPDPRKIAAWLRSDYESIAARAKREKAVIHWSGETGVRDRDLTGRGLHRKPDAGPDTDQAKILDEHGRRGEQSRPHAAQAL
jgi:Winged helix-turn helix